MDDMDLDPAAFVTVDGAVTTVDYPGILAAMTGSRPDDWEEVDGPDSGVGAGYHYARADGATAYVNSDQGRVSISITDLNGEDGSSVEFDMPDGEA